MNPPYQDHFQLNTISTPSNNDYYNTVFSHPDHYNPPPPPPPDTSSNHLLSQYYYQSHSNHQHGIPNGTLSPSAMESMREMIFRMAAMQPILDEVNLESVRPKQRKNVKISTDPQSVAARRRRERISERIRILQRMVPGGTKMDTASMLDEAARYVEFLKREVKHLENAAAAAGSGSGCSLNNRDQIMLVGSGTADGGSGSRNYYNYASGYENNSSSSSSTGNLEDVEGFTAASSY